MTSLLKSATKRSMCAMMPEEVGMLIACRQREWSSMRSRSHLWPPMADGRKGPRISAWMSRPQ